MLGELFGNGFEGVLPQLRGGLASLMLVKFIAEQFGILTKFAQAHAPAVDKDVAVGVVHRKGRGFEAELGHIRHGEVVRAGETHSSRLGVQTVAKRFTVSLQASAHALLRFEQDNIVSGAFELVRRHQTRHARADDEDAFGAGS